MAHGGEKEGQCGNRIPRCPLSERAPELPSMGTVRWTPRDNSASFPDIFVPYSFVCSWAPSANGRMSHSVANVVLVERGSQE